MLRRAIHALKYRGIRALAQPLGTLAASAYGRAEPGTVVVAVPSRRRRIALRGIDHARALSTTVAEQLSCPLHDGALRRTRPTRPQVGLEPGERWSNVAGAFVATGVDGRPCIVVDDVLTTGATAEACASALLRAGARQVDVCTVARATVWRPVRRTRRRRGQ